MHTVNHWTISLISTQSVLGRWSAACMIWLWIWRTMHSANHKPFVVNVFVCTWGMCEGSKRSAQPRLSKNCSLFEEKQRMVNKQTLEGVQKPRYLICFINGKHFLMLRRKVDHKMNFSWGVFFNIIFYWCFKNLTEVQKLNRETHGKCVYVFFSGSWVTISWEQRSSSSFTMIIVQSLCTSSKLDYGDNEQIKNMTNETESGKLGHLASLLFAYKILSMSFFICQFYTDIWTYTFKNGTPRTVLI